MKNWYDYEIKCFLLYCAGAHSMWGRSRKSWRAGKEYRMLWKCIFQSFLYSSSYPMSWMETPENDVNVEPASENFDCCSTQTTHNISSRASPNGPWTLGSWPTYIVIIWSGIASFNSQKVVGKTKQSVFLSPFPRWIRYLTATSNILYAFSNT